MLDTLTRRVAGIFSRMRGKGRLSEDDVNETLREVRVALLEADVNFSVAKAFISEVKEKAVGEEVFSSLNADQTILKIVRDQLVEILGGEETKVNWSPSPPTVVLMCGLQGSGKTTTTAKLATYFLRQGKKPMLAACDIQRPAAIKQLEVLGEQVGAPVFSLTDGTPPEKIAAQALDRCRYLMHDVLIVDTAGRLTIDQALMDELARIRDAVKPSESFLVLDSTTGQESVNVAQAFHERFALTGTIFTKMDGDTRGGAILSVRHVTGVPVHFIGVGEQTDALEVFYPKRVAERILGFGDVMGLIEKAELNIQKEDAEAMQAALQKGGMDFNMMLQAFQMTKKMGPLKGLMKHLPGAATLPDEVMDQIGSDESEKKMRQIEAMILSMTPKERTNPDIINGSRRKRIAAGSGMPVEEVNRLVNQYYGMRKMMKQATKMEKRMGKFKKGRR